MPTFIYEGPGHSLGLAGRTLTRGIPAELEGRAAEAAASHPDVTTLGASSPTRRGQAGTPAGLERHKELKARAKELGLAAKGKVSDLEAAIAAEEMRLADETGDGAG